MPKPLIYGRVEGLQDVLIGLSGKRVDDAKKAMKAKGLEVVRAARDDLRAKVPVLAGARDWKGRSGDLRRSIKAKSTRSGGAVLYADRSGGPSGKGYHIHMVDKGTKKRATKRGANRGTMPALDIVAGVRAAAEARATAELVPFVTDAIVSGFKKAAKQ